MTKLLNILLVEDSAGDARLFEEEARDGGLGGLRVTQATTIDEALKLNASGGFDLIVLDLNLPDARGLATIERMIEGAGETPVIVLTTLADEVLGAQALVLGAEDYLVKGECESWQLVRAMHHAVTRSRRGARNHESAETAPSGGDAGADEWLGVAPMKGSLPHVFDDLVGNVADLLSLAAEVTDDQVNKLLMPHVRTLAARLSMLTATPGDVGEILRAAAMRREGHAGWSALARARPKIAEQMLLALLGALCEQYKSDALDDGRAGGLMSGAGA